MTPIEVITHIAASAGTTLAALQAQDRRTQSLVHVRQLAWLVALELAYPETNYSELGRLVQRDNSTVRAGILRCRHLLETDERHRDWARQVLGDLWREELAA